jgi:ABC-type bacteriocin/lantibiotic exporter with double-glycine peptidase domain
MRPAAFLWCCLPFVSAAAEVRLDVPFVRQEKNGCGAAVIAMLLEYWHAQQPQRPEPADVKEIQRELFSREARGILASDLERYLREHGFRTFAVRGEWRDLQHHLAKGRPLIVALRPAADDLHYVALTGIDAEGGIVLKHDPAVRGFVQQRRAEFEREWAAAGNWMLLAVPSR